MPARLHHERIAGATSVRWMLLTHGIFGAGGNWRSIARKLTERRPDWGVVLVDLRGHGRSEAGQPPHDLAACAHDLRALIDELALPVVALAGHSFGGKVVLETRALAPPGLRQIWMLDASPAARPEIQRDPTNTVAQVLALMEQLPKVWATRDDFIAAIVAAGHPLPLAQWLAMNLGPGAAGAFVLRLDLAAIRAMVADYCARDLWSAAFTPDGDVELVIADRSSVVTVQDRARLAGAPAHVHVHHIDAGHWLHIDAPGPVVDMFAARLP